jgi:hypothetical protein
LVHWLIKVTVLTALFLSYTKVTISLNNFWCKAAGCKSKEIPSNRRQAWARYKLPGAQVPAAFFHSKCGMPAPPKSLIAHV